MKKSPFPKVRYCDPSGFEGSALAIMDYIVNGKSKLNRVDVSRLVESDNSKNDE